VPVPSAVCGCACVYVGVGVSAYVPICGVGEGCAGCYFVSLFSCAHMRVYARKLSAYVWKNHLKKHIPFL